MLIDIKQVIPDPARTSEVLVVGAGAVGLALGVQLARSGVKVTILEGGPANPPADFRDANRGPSTGRAYRGMIDGRMQALGGTTRLWGGQLIPFGEEDLAPDVFPGKPGWPLPYADYRHWVDRAFALLGVAPEAREQGAVWRKATGRSDAFGERLVLGMNVWLPQPDFAKLFARDIAANPHLTIVTGARVDGIAFTPGGAVRSVATPRGTFSGRRVVLACGTLEIARLLLRTAATDANCGFAANRHLGRWFIDHLHGVAGEVRGADPARIGDLFDYIHHQGTRFGVKARLGAPTRQAGGLPNAVATVNPAISLHAMLTDLVALLRRAIQRQAGDTLWSAARNAAAMLRMTIPMGWRYLVNRRSSLPFSGGVMLGVEVEQVPSADSYLFLAPDQPPEQAAIGVHWSIDGREMEAVQAVCFALRDAFHEQGLGEVVLDPRIAAGDTTFLADCHDAYHHMGGARMALSAADGVVDPDLKVFGTQNLYVAGAATFPSGSFANPTLTALALAMRLADRLSAEERVDAA